MSDKTERSYQDSSGQLDVIIKTAVDGIIIINELGTVQLFNPACEKLFKHSAKDIVGKNVKILMPAPYREEHDEYLSNYTSTGTKKIIGIGREVSGMRKDGSTFPMELSVGEAGDEEGRFYVGIIRDITERKAAEDSLRESEARIRAVIDTAVDGVIIINADATIQIFNPACEQLFGYTSSEVIGRNVNVLMPAPYADEHDGYLKNYRDTGVKKIIGIGREVTGRRKDGSTFPMELSVGEVLENGQPVFVGIIRDITDRKLAQQEIEDNVRELAAFSYSVAHDLKAPLRAIAGFSNALEEDYASLLDETAKEYLTHIGDGVTHMGEMIDDLLEYSRIGRDDLPFKKMPVRQLIDYAINNHRSLIDEMDAEISFSGEWCMIEGHQASLQGVFQNLIGNAIKFARPNVRPIVELHSKVGPHEVEISIADNGIGIPEDCWDKVFQIFHRLHHRSKYPGTGIGLAIVQKGVSLHKGSISLDSSPGNGTCFKVVLPKRRPA